MDKNNEKTMKLEKRKHRGSIKHLLPLLLLLIVLAVGVIGAESVFAQTSITLKPGDTYNLSKAGKNTSVYINKPGTYTLKGTTRYVRVVITCGKVKCYLDDVNMNAGAYTQTGQVASPLNIVDDGGTDIFRQDADLGNGDRDRRPDHELKKFGGISGK